MGKIVTSVILIFLAGMLFFWQTVPAFDEIDLLKAKRDSFNEALSYSKELIVLRNRLIADYTSISSVDMEKLLKICPAGADIPKLVMQISDMAVESGVSIENIDAVERQVIFDPSGAAGLGACSKIDLTISFSANYDDFSVFLAEMEKSLRLIDIEEADVFTSDTGTYNFNIKALTYYTQ